MYRPQHIIKDNVRSALLILAAIYLTGCTNNDGPKPADPVNSVSFGAYISDMTQARASVANINTLRQTGFGVFASQTGTDDFNPDATEGFTPSFMHNQLVQWSPLSSDNPDYGSWVYLPQKSWPSSKVSFFAYAPYTASFGKTGITKVSGADASGSPRISFTINKDIDHQIDLLCADSQKTTDLTRGQTVQFCFKHALSRIKFRCGAFETLDKNTTLTLNSISLKSSSLSVAGDLNLYSAAWENLVSGENAYTLTTDDFIKGNNLFTHADATTVCDLTRNNKYIMIIPSNKLVPVEITVNYDVTTTDDRLPEGSIKISNSITNYLELNFETGIAYDLTLRIGSKSVKITAETSEWDISDNDWTPIEKH